MSTLSLIVDETQRHIWYFWRVEFQTTLKITSWNKHRIKEFYNGTNYEDPYCGALPTRLSHASWAQIVASESCFQLSSESFCDVSEQISFTVWGWYLMPKTTIGGSLLNRHSTTIAYSRYSQLTSISGDLLPHPQPEGTHHSVVIGTTDGYTRIFIIILLLII